MKKLSFFHTPFSYEHSADISNMSDLSLLFYSITSVNHFPFHIRLSPPTLNHFTDVSKMVYSSFFFILS